MRGPVRVVRTGHVQSVLHATEAIADRSLFIRHQLLSELEDVLCWTLAEYVGDCWETRAAEMCLRRSGRVVSCLIWAAAPCTTRWIRFGGFVPVFLRLRGGAVVAALVSAATVDRSGHCERRLDGRALRRRRPTVVDVAAVVADESWLVATTGGGTPASTVVVAAW